MEFNSQICTTKEQSERLITFGLKKETADCVMMYYDGWHIGEAEHFDFYKDPVDPAWSLHRLIAMMPYDVTYNNNTYELQITDNGAGYDDIEDLYSVVGWWRSNTYDDIIDCIEWLIKGSHFNKEYLEE